MIQKIEISNFKSFDKNFIFDLSDTKNFSFSKESVENGIVNNAIIYGHNGIGKSNLGLAFFDMISHITDKRFTPERYDNYLNANNPSKYATFSFEFKFDDSTLKYKYTKENVDTLLDEELIINNKVFASIKRKDGEEFIFETDAKGTELLNKNLQNSTISILKYINSNTVLEDTVDNNCFKQFIKFVENMLFFRNLDDRYYLGFDQNTYSLEENIIENGNLLDFEEFLNSAGIKCKLGVRDSGERLGIDFVFENRNIPFFEIASSGTVSLTLFYFWYQRLKNEENCSLLFIDEFDAFYHHSLSKSIIEKLKNMLNTQVILTTHNTTIISNDILRPDCYFLMYEDKIKSLSNSTPKDLREAHNIEKMYRAGSFE